MLKWHVDFQNGQRVTVSAKGRHEAADAAVEQSGQQHGNIIHVFNVACFPESDPAIQKVERVEREARTFGRMLANLERVSDRQLALRKIQLHIDKIYAPDELYADIDIEDIFTNAAMSAWKNPA